jgi:DNA modification methylase
MREAVSLEQPTLIMLSPEAITERLRVRRLSASGIRRLQHSMQCSGFLTHFPLVVSPLAKGGYKLIDGNHRYEAALALGLVSIPCIVQAPLSELDRYTFVWQSNNAAENAIPSTLVTYAEFIRDLTGEGYTQTEIATVLGWSREKVKNYVALDQITKEAWKIIGTTFEKDVPMDDENGVPVVGPSVPPFTEGLLRAILDLSAEQQVELVTELATNKDFSKGKFKVRAEHYRSRNEMSAYAEQQLGALGEAFLTKLHEEIARGSYDSDWNTNDHPKLQKLMASLRDEWERKHSIHLIHGDFYEEVEKLGNGCIDLILTDPPYTIARENTFVLEGRSNISQDFGAWDKHTKQECLALFDVWARAWARLLRAQGSGYVFTSDRLLSHLREALEAAGLHIKATIIWYKTNPGTQVVKTNYKSSVEHVLFFTKGEGGHTFNWQGENDMHNHIEVPICSGAERLVDAKGKILHPTQKPERLLRHFLEISSNRGDTVFDGFAGVGSACAVAKQLGRKCIGIEHEKTFFEAMQRRLAE